MIDFVMGHEILLTINGLSHSLTVAGPIVLESACVDQTYKDGCTAWYDRLHTESPTGKILTIFKKPEIELWKIVGPEGVLFRFDGNKFLPKTTLAGLLVAQIVDIGTEFETLISQQAVS